MSVAMMAVAVGVGFLVGVVAPFGLIPVLSQRGIIDLPNDRSSHAQPTVRGGGIAVVAGICAGATFMGIGTLAAGEHLPVSLLIAIYAILSLSTIGLIEDVRGLSVRWRLFLQLAVVFTATAWMVGTSDLSFLIAILILIAGPFYVNAANFMDGINGISSANGTISGLYFAALGLAVGDQYLATTGGVMAAAFLAFAPWNFPKARIFLGDVGSYALGASGWALATWAVTHGISLAAAIAPMVIYSIDVLYTLVSRAKQREPLLTAHRRHVYQQLAQLGGSHTRATLITSSATVMCATAAIVTILLSTSTGTLACLFAVVGLAYCLLPWLWRRKLTTSGLRQVTLFNR